MRPPTVLIVFCAAKRIKIFKSANQESLKQTQISTDLTPLRETDANGVTPKISRLLKHLQT